MWGPSRPARKHGYCLDGQADECCHTAGGNCWSESHLRGSTLHALCISRSGITTLGLLLLIEASFKHCAGFIVHPHMTRFHHPAAGPPMQIQHARRHSAARKNSTNKIYNSRTARINSHRKLSGSPKVLQLLQGEIWVLRIREMPQAFKDLLM